ncbi:MAG: hypothetical protein ACYDBQ_11870 [Thermoplasmatota archaeon]
MAAFSDMALLALVALAIVATGAVLLAARHIRRTHQAIEQLLQPLEDLAYKQAPALQNEVARLASQRSARPVRPDLGELENRLTRRL